jgi:ribosomal protein S15
MYGYLKVKWSRFKNPTGFRAKKKSDKFFYELESYMYINKIENSVNGHNIMISRIRCGPHSVRAFSSAVSSHSSASSGAVSASAATPIASSVTGRLPYRFPNVAVPPSIAPVLGLATANNKEVLAYKSRLAADQFRSHSLDSGSTPVQSKSFHWRIHLYRPQVVCASLVISYTILLFASLTLAAWFNVFTICIPFIHSVAVLTERINSLAAHVATHKKDHSGKRGFQALITHRRRLMQYLRRTRFDLFKSTVEALGLQSVALNMPVQYRNRGTKRGN